MDDPVNLPIFCLGHGIGVSTDKLYSELPRDSIAQPAYPIERTNYCTQKHNVNSRPTNNVFCGKNPSFERLRLFLNIAKELLLKNFLCYHQYYISNFDKLKPKFRRKPFASLRTNIFLFVFVFIFCINLTCAFNKDGQPPRSVANSLEKISRHKGETVVLSCPVAGKPRPEIIWKKDGEQISRDWKRFKPVGTRLKIRKAELTDGGLYQCQAVNGFGSAQTKHFQLQIIDQASNGHSRRRDTVKPIFTQPVKMRRHSYIKPQGGTVSFRCKAKGKPRPRIQWFKDGNLTELKGTTGGFQWILTLRNIDARDSGRYTCRVWNSAGQISFDYTLRVVGSQHERPVLIKPHPVNTTVEVGERASLQCRVRSELPPTVKWIKRLSPESLRSFQGQLPNNTLQIDGNYYLFLPSQEMVILPDGSYLNKLVISPARLTDSGIYICLGANTMGYTFRFAYLTVNTGSSVDVLLSDNLSSEKQTLPLAAIIGIPAAVGVLVVCIITIYCANNGDRFLRWSKTQQNRQCERTKMHYDGASRLSSSSSTSAGNVEVVVDTHESVRSQLAPLEEEFSPLASLRSDDPLNQNVSVNPYRDKMTSDFTESEFASNYVPPPPPPSQHSRSSCSSSRYSRSHRSCNHHRHHSARREHHHARNNSLHSSQCSRHYTDDCYSHPTKH